MAIETKVSHQEASTNTGKPQTLVEAIPLSSYTHKPHSRFPPTASLYRTAQCNSASDCLVLAAHVLLLETGFLPQDCDVRAGEMPSGWCPVASFYRLEYTHPLLRNSLVQVLAVLVIKTLDIYAILNINSAAVESWRMEVCVQDYVTEEWAGAEYDTMFIK
ncbi:F-box only protein 7 [Tachysurus ichikawai]